MQQMMRQMLSQKRLSLEAVTAALVFWAALALVVLFAYLGWVCYISDSEIWSVTLAANIGDEWRHFWVATRPLFYGLLGLAEWPTQSPVATFLAARSVFIANGLLIIYLTFKLAQKISMNKIVPWLSVVLLVGNSGFLNQGFRIRSDLLATSVTLWILCGVFEAEPSRWLWLRFLLLPMATPKAIFQMLCLLPFWPKIAPKWIRDPHWAFRLVCIVLAVVVAVGAALGHVYSEMFAYFVSTFQPGAGTPPLFSSSGFMYVTRIVTKNPLFIASLLLSFVATSLRREEMRIRYTMCMLLLVLWIVFTPEKISFFLASLLPPLCVFAALWVEEAGQWIPAFVALAVIGGGLTSIQEFKKNLTENSNVQELKTSLLLDRYLARYPGARFYDVIGIVPKRAKFRLFAGPNDSVENRITAKRVTEIAPELIFYVNKMHFLEPEIGRMLHENYFALGGDIFARAYVLKTPIRLASKDAGEVLEASLRSVAHDLCPSLPVEIGIEIQFDREHNDIIVGHLDELKNWFRRSQKALKHAEIVRISPFSPPAKVLYGSMDHLFHFDTNF